MANNLGAELMYWQGVGTMNRPVGGKRKIWEFSGPKKTGRNQQWVPGPNRPRGGGHYKIWGGVVLKPALKHEAAEKLFDDACNLVHAAATCSDSEFGKRGAWFEKGARESERQAVRKMAGVLQGDKFKLRYSQKKRFLGAYDHDFYLENVAQLGLPILWTRYTWGEKVVTLLHEMSHVFLNTVDLGAGGTYSSPSACVSKMGGCYGFYACQLVTNPSLREMLGGTGVSYKNAENWGYFIGNFFSLAGMGSKLHNISSYNRVTINKVRSETAYLGARADMDIIDPAITDR